MESFKRRSTSLYGNPLSPTGGQKLNFAEAKAQRHRTPVRQPRDNELLTGGLGDYITGVPKAPKIATLLGQTGEELRKQILNRI